MRYLKTVAVLVVLSGACIDLPEIQQVPETPDAGEPGEHTGDSGIPPDASVPDSGTPDAGAPTLAVTLETSRAITNADVQVRAQVIGPPPDEVELMADGVAVAVLAPPYELRWNTQSLDEGTHVLSVRASLGERDFTSEARPLVVDRTPPRLTSQVPSTGAQAVSVHQTIQATFSEPLDPATVSAETVVLRTAAGVLAADVVLTPEGHSLVVQPDVLLPADSTLQVQLAGTLADLAGNTLEALPQEWEWKVPGYLPLGAPLSANATDGSEAQHPSLKIDGAGRPVVAWLDATQLEPYGVHVRRWNGTSWEPLGAALSISVGSTSNGCSLMFDGEGRPLVVWDEQSASGGVSVRIRRWNGSTWEPLGTSDVLLPQPLGADFIIFAGDGQGQLVAALREFNQGATSVSVWRWDGRTWARLGSSLKVDSARGVSSLRMALDPAGNPFVSWSESDLGGNLGAYMRHWNGSAWTSIPMPAQSHAVALIVDDTGAPVFNVGAWDGAALSVQLRRWNGSSWATLGSPINSYPGATESAVAALQLDAQRKLVVLIGEPETSGGPPVYSVRQWDGGAWTSVGSPLRVNPGSAQQGVTSLALDSTGQPMLARIEYALGVPGKRRLHVYRANH
jgi:hypothetical protein